MSRLQIKVVPGASSSGIAGWLGDALKIRVSAPPEKGKANKEVLALLSEVLQVPLSSLKISRGSSSSLKSIEVETLAQEELQRRLAKLTSGQ